MNDNETIEYIRKIEKIYDNGELSKDFNITLYQEAVSRALSKGIITSENANKLRQDHIARLKSMVQEMSQSSEYLLK